MTKAELEQRIRVAHSLADRLSSRSLLGYLDRVVIDSRPEPRRFGAVADPWQWEDAKLLAPVLESVAGVREYEGPRSVWITRGRGHDKTSSIGRFLNWLLGYSPRHLSIVVAAGDSDQAGLIVEAMGNEARLNPWLASRVRLHRDKAYGPGGYLKVLSADAATSMGLNADVLIVDELTHWKKPDLWEVLWTGREKRPGAVAVVITNAGVLGTWQDRLHKLALASPSDWLVRDTPPGVHLASWMSKEAINRLRSMFPRGLAKRVIDNIWIDPAEEADFLTRAEIEACDALGRLLGLTYQVQGRKGIRYVAGIDYGPRRDRTALVVLHAHPAGAQHAGPVNPGTVVVDRLDVWQGSPDEPILIQAIDDWLSQQRQAFPNLEVVFDPYQMEGLAQKWEQRMRVERFEARGGKRTYEMAENLRSLIVSKQLVWYPGAGTLVVNGYQETLVDEIAGLIIKPTPYGYRFDHEAAFHDDRAVAIGMAALHAVRMDPSGPGVLPGTVAVEEVKTFIPGVRVNRDQRPASSRRGIWGT
jgi:hypothetical protein